MGSKIFFLLLTLITYITSQQSNFNLNLGKVETKCFKEYFPDKTFVIFEINTFNSTINISLSNPDGSGITSEKTSLFKYPFTTFSGGYYEICLKNEDNNIVKVNFQMKYGVAAKDYSSVARTKDLKPIDLELEKLTDRTNHMSHYTNYAQGHEKVFERYLDKITARIIIFSFILICVMIVIGLIETLYLKKFMERRKII